MEANNAVAGEHSTAQRVKRSLVMVLVGRSLSAIAGFFVLVLLSRLLGKAEYGQYFAIWAILEILILVSDPGIIHLIYRYVSATADNTKTVSPRGPARAFLLARLMFLALASLLLLAVPQGWFAFLNMQQVTLFIHYVCLILIFEGGARTVEAIFDSMLCQNASQTSTILRTAIRLLGLLWIMWFAGTMQLELLLMVEVAATFIGLLVALIMLARIYSKANVHSQPIEAGNALSFRTMLYYAAPAYLSQLLGVLFSIDLLKLILSRFQSNQELALFGFVFSVTLVIQRYIPASLLGGIFRPVFVAESKKEDPSRRLVELFIASLKINWIFIALILCASFIMADVLLLAISKGNYQNAAPIFIISLLGLFGFSAHQLLSYLCIARRNPWPVLIANVVTAAGVVISVSLSASLGAKGAALAFGINEFIWCLACLLLVFKGEPFGVYADLNGLVRLLLITIGLIASAWLLELIFHLKPVYIAFLMFVPTVIAFCQGGIFSIKEGQWIMATIPAGRQLARFVKFRPLR